MVCYERKADVKIMAIVMLFYIRHNNPATNSRIRR
ncbi:hypothetical protein ENINCP361B_14710 [Enterobacter intestinihominis]